MALSRPRISARAGHLVCGIRLATMIVKVIRMPSPSTFADHSRCPNQDRDKITKGTQSDEKVQASHSISRAENFCEE